MRAYRCSLFIFKAYLLFLKKVIKKYCIIGVAYNSDSLKIVLWDPFLVWNMKDAINLKNDTLNPLRKV